LEPLFREVTKKDFNKIKSMMEKAWEYQSMFDENFMGEIIVDSFLNEVLHNSSYGQVATLHGEVVGVIFGRVVKETPKLRMLETHMEKQLRDVLTASKKDQKTFINYFDAKEQSHEALMKNQQTDYDSSIELFIVDEKARGHHIGTALLEGIEDYFKQNDAKNTFLYTDTGCNYTFYDYKEFNQAEEYTPSGFERIFDEGFTYFLYDKKYK